LMYSYLSKAPSNRAAVLGAFSHTWRMPFIGSATFSISAGAR
jgi:hypothetical protein